MRLLLIATVAASAALTAPALAQSASPVVPAAVLSPVPLASHAAVKASPHPSSHASAKPASHPTPFMTFSYPGPGKPSQSTMSGADCMRGGSHGSAQTINPITGQKQASTFVSVPITKGGGSVASSTNRAQQQQTCAQSNH